MKALKRFIHETEMDENASLMFRPFLTRKVSFGTLSVLKTVLTCNWICLIKTIYVKTHLTIFRVINFLSKKVTKLVETQKFCHGGLNYLISRINDSFFDKINFRKFEF